MNYIKDLGKHGVIYCHDLELAQYFFGEFTIQIQNIFDKAREHVS